MGDSVLSSRVFSSKSSLSSDKSNKLLFAGVWAVADTWFEIPPASTSACLIT